MNGKILIACVGNIFIGDDAFGVEVGQRLVHTNLPKNVIVRDFGIRSFDLAYALMDDWEMTILVDAVPREQAPGTVYVIEPEIASNVDAVPDAHSMNPASVLGLVDALGGKVGKILVVGCEPASVEPSEDGRIGLSPPVQAAVEEAITVVQELIATNARATAA